MIRFITSQLYHEIIIKVKDNIDDFTGSVRRKL